MQDKKELRKHFSAVRAEAKSPEKDRLITERVLSHDRIAAADTVLLYASFGSEVDTWELAERLIGAGKTIAYPKCGSSGAMTFHIVSDIAALRADTSGKYGICEPSGELPCPELSGDTVCILPGLAFTENGGRLGYGGGFYDRFLAAYPHIFRIAAAYEALLTDSLPVMEHDITINHIVTEERTVLCNE